MALNTSSEVLDLSKENIQPLRHGRKAVQLKTALQAQKDPEVRQMLLKQRDEFEYMIRMYEGDDPLEPYYNYVIWLEQSFPKMGHDCNFIPLLEDILSKFKDYQKYKQDIRFVQLLVKYITVQPNPLELYQLVYHQGLGTMCSLLYKSWAEELDTNGDFKRADQVYQLGIRCRAQPLQELENDHVQFQLSIARRMLEGNLDMPASSEPPVRTVLSKLRPSTVKSSRTSRESAGVLQPFCKSLSNINANRGSVKVYEEESDTGCIIPENKYKNLDFCRNSVADRENIMEPGRWCGAKQKLLPGFKATAPANPYFEVLEDPESASAVIKTSRPRALKIKKEFKCPVAIFEPPDDTKKPMYPKHLVYVGGRDVQLEEIRAAYYWKNVKKTEIEKNVVDNVLEEPVDLTKSSNTSVDRKSELTSFSSDSATKPPLETELPCDQMAWDEVDCANVNAPPGSSRYSPLPGPVNVISRRTTFSRISMSEVTATSSHERSWCPSTLPQDSKPVYKPASSDSSLVSKTINAEISTRERSWYLATEFIRPVKLPIVAAQNFPPTNSEPESGVTIRGEAASLKRKSDFAEETNIHFGLNVKNGCQNSVPDNARCINLDYCEPHIPVESDRRESVLTRIPKTEDEILDYSSHSNKSNASAFHHSPSASFTVNTRAAYNIIHKMWESPLAPRSAKMNKPDEDFDSVNLFKVPAARKSQCFKFPIFPEEEVENNLQSAALPFTVFTDEPSSLAMIETRLSFPVFPNENKSVEKAQTIPRTIESGTGSLPLPKDDNDREYALQKIENRCFAELRSGLNDEKRSIPDHGVEKVEVGGFAETRAYPFSMHCDNDVKMMKMVQDLVDEVGQEKDCHSIVSRVYSSPLYFENGEQQVTNAPEIPTTPSRKPEAVMSTGEDEKLSKSMSDLKVTERKTGSEIPAPLIIPINLQDTPPTQPENKENRPPCEYFAPNVRKRLEEIQVPIEIVKEVDQPEDDEFGDEDTCSTKAFAIPLPSSTPFSRADGFRKSRKSSIFNGSYISEDYNNVIPHIPAVGQQKLPWQQSCEVPPPAHLSLILENSKELGYSPAESQFKPGMRKSD